MSFAAQRSRRSNAGNRMQELLEREHERIKKREAAGVTASTEAEADDEDFAAPVEIADEFDSDFDAAEDQAGEEAGSEADEQLLQEEREEARRQRERKQRVVPTWPAAPPKPPSKQQVAKPTAPIDSAAVGPADVITPLAATPAVTTTTKPRAYLPARRSSRTQTVQSKHQLEARLKQEELRRSLLPRKEKVPQLVMSQADRLLEAKQTERDNLAELKNHLALEEQEEKRRRHAWSSKRNRLVGPTIQTHSFLDEDKPLEVTTRMPREVFCIPRTFDGVYPPACTPRSTEISLSQTSTPNIDVEMLSESGDDPSSSDLAIDTSSTSIQPSAMTNEQASGSNELDGPTVSSIKANVTPTEAVAPVDDLRGKKRTFVSISFSDYSAFNRTFSTWRTRSVPYPQPEKCAISGLPARYRDPHTGLYYANAQAFSRLRRLAAGGYQWDEQLGVYQSSLQEHSPQMLQRLGIQGALCVVTGQPATGYEPHTGLPCRDSSVQESLRRTKDAPSAWLDQTRSTGHADMSSIIAPPLRMTTRASAVDGALACAQAEATVKQLLANNDYNGRCYGAEPQQSIYREDQSDDWFSDDS